MTTAEVERFLWRVAIPTLFAVGLTCIVLLALIGCEEPQPCVCEVSTTPDLSAMREDLQRAHDLLDNRLVDQRVEARVLIVRQLGRLDLRGVTPCDTP